MSYSSYLIPRSEVLSSEIEGIIDIANLKDETKIKIEARPKDFLDLHTRPLILQKLLSRLTYGFLCLKRAQGFSFLRVSRAAGNPTCFY